MPHLQQLLTCGRRSVSPGYNQQVLSNEF